MYPAMHSFSFRDKFKNDPGFNIDAAFELCASMGFKSMEVMTGGAGSPPADIGADSVDGLTRVLARGRTCDVKIHCYATYNDFAFVKNDTWRGDNIVYIQQWLKLAAATNVPNIRMLTGYYAEGHDPARLEELVVQGIEACVPVAEESGVNLAIENHSSVFAKGSEIVALIKRLGSSRLTTCPDPSNGFPLLKPECTDADREAMYANLEVMAPYATNSHLKVKSANLAEWDLDRLIGIYMKAGYQGPITFEWMGEGNLVPQLIEARKVLEAALEKHGVRTTPKATNV